MKQRKFKKIHISFTARLTLTSNALFNLADGVFGILNRPCQLGASFVNALIQLDITRLFLRKLRLDGFDGLFRVREEFTIGVKLSPSFGQRSFQLETFLTTRGRACQGGPLFKSAANSAFILRSSRASSASPGMHCTWIESLTHFLINSSRSARRALIAPLVTRGLVVVAAEANLGRMVGRIVSVSTEESRNWAQGLPTSSLRDICVWRNLFISTDMACNLARVTSPASRSIAAPSRHPQWKSSLTRVRCVIRLPLGAQ